MKKIFTFSFLFVCCVSSFLFSQPTTHPFELGINAGASWLTSDVRVKKPGAGFGLTFGQTYGMNKKNMFTLGWRLRFLDANTFGQDYHRSYGIKNNEVLNGSTDSSLDYIVNPGYVYQNYKTHLDEFSAEIVLSLNQGVYYAYPYIFGGAGITRAVTHTDQLDENGMPYDYASVDGNAGKSGVLSQLKTQSDGTYETLAEGNLHPGWKFMPSVGAGIGWELTPGFSLGLEYKLTWALNDVLDGQRWSENNTPTAHNDLYNYASVWLKLSFGRRHKVESTHTPAVVTDTYTPPPAPLPVITITNPPSPGLVTAQQLLVLSGRIYNISDVNSMHITVNGIPASGYAYNPETHEFSFPVQLIPGVNNFDVSAANPSGTVDAVTSLAFEPPVIMPPGQLPPPVVEIREPLQNPYFTNNGIVTVRGAAMHISSAHELQVTVNGFPDHSVVYNPSAHTFSVTSHLVPGANTFVVTATNASGNDTKATTVILQGGGIVSSPRPEVRIISPNYNPYSTVHNVISISANVKNVESRNAITVIANGYPDPDFTYDPGTGMLNFTMHLVQGNNTLQIQAVNAAGSETKDQSVMYGPPVAPPAGPEITITNPAVNPFTSTSLMMTVNAKVEQVTSTSQIAVTLNGTPLSASALNFIPASHQLAFRVNLVAGANTIQITATNAGGSASKSQTIIYSSPVTSTPLRPVVTITDPAASPYTATGNPAAISATVLNITSASQITASVNGSVMAPAMLSYNAAAHQASFSANLVNGSNTILVKATNAAGIDLKSTTIIYLPVAVTPKPVITITSPASDPYNSPDASAGVEATVTNITSVAQLAVMLNGNTVPAGLLNYNTTSHQLSFTVNLSPGLNTVMITATNSAGSDSRSATIKLATAPVVLSKPVIAFINPAANPFSTSAAVFTLKARIVGISGASGITVTLNGNAVPASAWSYNLSTQEFSYPLSLGTGSNAIRIRASNTAGSVTGTQQITRTSGAVTPVHPAVTPGTPGTPPRIRGTAPEPATATPAPEPVTMPSRHPAAVVAEPQILLVTPAVSTVSTTDATYTVVVKVENVGAAAGISVTVNGTAFSGFTFDPGTGSLSVPVTLAAGANTVLIEASNTAGNKTQKVVLTR